MTKIKNGTIIVPPGVFIDVHEKMVADFLATRVGNDVTFLMATRRKNIKTPDIEMSGLYWEIKSPIGKSSRTIENNLRAAVKQSCNIIIDLRRMDGRIPTQKSIKEIERRFNDAKSIKRIIIITRQETYVDLSK